ncbi:MAG: hypothetical protein DMG70_05800 [Acidobacteria bacterium]|nr:MAG: hypothetical protein DMG70_05800 [Acidobacteriota bacterium]PYY03804.1 MAG: hypothetical protein DMG69_31850 [Acidobacteriota bacterium]
MPDQLSAQYADLLNGTYDCVDRIILNAYFPRGVDDGGFRCWWRALHGNDKNLDNAHLIRMAGRFSRRLRAWAKANRVPVLDCPPGERKHEIAQEYLSKHSGQCGLFLVLVSRSPALAWDIQMSGTGKLGNIQRKEPRPYVNHYHFHILDPDWGHITIKMSGHPPFGAEVMLNGHEYVACQASKKQIPFSKDGNCFVDTSDAAGLAAVAVTLSEEPTIGRLRQICERWIYSTCLLFGLSLEEQQRTGFQYEYSIYQIEYSRNLQFQSGASMDQVFQSLIDRTRRVLDLDQVKTIFGCRKRPCWRKLRQARYGVVIETPTYDLTVFKVHFGKLTLKIYTKGERVLRIEVIVHNSKELPCGRSLPNFPQIVILLRGMLERFLEVLHCMDSCFISDDLLERLPKPSRVGRTKVGGIDYNQPRIRSVIWAVLALSAAPSGFTASDLAKKIYQLTPGDSSAYTPRQAAYDLKKLRGKSIVERIDSSHRYRSSATGIRALTALVVLRDKVIKPLLASSCHRKRGPKPKNSTVLDTHYEHLQTDMQHLLTGLGIAA